MLTFFAEPAFVTEPLTIPSSNREPKSRRSPLWWRVQHDGRVVGSLAVAARVECARTFTLSVLDRDRRQDLADVVERDPD
jgi:hypothetical protein